MLFPNIHVPEIDFYFILQKDILKFYTCTDKTSFIFAQESAIFFSKTVFIDLLVETYLLIFPSIITKEFRPILLILAKTNDKKSEDPICNTK